MAPLPSTLMAFRLSSSSSGHVLLSSILSVEGREREREGENDGIWRDELHIVRRGGGGGGVGRGELGVRNFVWIMCDALRFVLMTKYSCVENSILLFHLGFDVMLHYLGWISYSAIYMPILFS